MAGRLPMLPGGMIWPGSTFTSGALRCGPSGCSAPKFLLAEVTAPSDTGSANPSNGDASDITIVLHGGRQLRCRDGIAEAALVRLVRAIEAA